jgi:hypothetical protein
VGHGLAQQLPPPELELEPRLQLVELALSRKLLLGLLSLAGLGTPAPSGRPGRFGGWVVR